MYQQEHFITNKAASSVLRGVGHVGLAVNTATPWQTGQLHEMCVTMMR